MSVKITYFVHGTTTDNEKGLATGQLPGELSEKGIGQSIRLKGEINLNDFDIAISSDLKRAVDSANNIFKGVVDILHDARIRECDYGDLNGKPNDLIKYEDHIDDPFSNGESLKDVEMRVKDFCNYLLENFDEKHVAVIAHKAPQLAFNVLTQGITWGVAIDTDWRKTGDWKPGWEYIIN